MGVGVVKSVASFLQGENRCIMRTQNETRGSNGINGNVSRVGIPKKQLPKILNPKDHVRRTVLILMKENPLRILMVCKSVETIPIKVSPIFSSFHSKVMLYSFSHNHGSVENGGI